MLLLGQDFQPSLERAAGNASGEVIELLDTPGLDLKAGDPHVWLDPRRFATIGAAIGQAMGNEAAARSFVRRLEALDREYRAGLSACRRRDVVTSHEAFGYLADRYGLREVAISGISPEAEPAPGDLQGVIEVIRETGATTVFTEPLVSPRLAQTVAAETGGTTAVLDPLEGLTPEEESAGDDYFTVMRRNLAALEDGARVPVVSVSGVRFAYGRGPAVLDGIDLVVERGEFVGVAGPNGGGKTTLMRLIVGLDRPAAGRVELFGSPPEQSHRRSRVGYLPQRATLGLDAPITVRELVTAGRSPLRGLLWPRGAKDRRAIDEAIERVGLSATAGSTLQTLSGGQRQRAFIAKLLAGDPELLILDEPTAGVDAPAQEALAALLDRLRRELGVTILYVSHEFGAIEPYVGRLVVVQGRHRLRRAAGRAAAALARPIASPRRSRPCRCLTSSSCASPWRPGRWSGSSPLRWASSSCRGT